ncbi:MAG TPA: hydroxymethylbilane synthase [Dehalococcoidia bacterium]|nr:hydroxymethylbilane synthase [Dehalococcoidia bacterium]
MPRTFVIGTRGSALALRQVEIVAAALRSRHADLRFEVREIRTEGDRSSAPLSAIGGLGVFTKAIEDALLAREVDLAVHSLKDLPADLTPGLALAAIPARADPRDALVTRNGSGLDALPPGARIGTGAGRRAVQLRALRPDAVPEEIRGNVDTRIRKVREGQYDGAVLAAAGLDRLGLLHEAAQVFSVAEMLPAVGQAALAVQTRADDDEARALAAAIDDAQARVAVTAERAFLRTLGAGCRLPVAGYATVEQEALRLRALVATDDGRLVRADERATSDEAEALGERVGRALLAESAARA